MSINARAGNDVGVDPHKHTLTATVLDERGGVLGTASCKVSGSGHRELEAWVGSFGHVRRWGIEGASGLGRHVSAFLALRGHDVRDVNPNRTNDRRRRRQQGKTDNSDSLRIPREVQAEPGLPVAFKRAGGDVGPDETTELIGLWHKARKSLLKSRQHLLNESEALLVALPVELREELPDTSQVRPRLVAVTQRDRSRRFDAATELRLRLLEDNWTQINDLDAREREATRELSRLCAQVSTLDELVGLSTRSVARTATPGSRSTSTTATSKRSRRRPRTDLVDSVRLRSALQRSGSALRSLLRDRRLWCLGRHKSTCEHTRQAGGPAQSPGVAEISEATCRCKAISATARYLGAED
jgi:hypothetical protein